VNGPLVHRRVRLAIVLARPAQPGQTMAGYGRSLAAVAGGGKSGDSPQRPRFSTLKRGRWHHFELTLADPLDATHPQMRWMTPRKEAPTRA